jgi:hypothetical protein
MTPLKIPLIAFTRGTADVFVDTDPKDAVTEDGTGALAFPDAIGWAWDLLLEEPVTTRVPIPADCSSSRCLHVVMRCPTTTITSSAGRMSLRMIEGYMDFLTLAWCSQKEKKQAVGYPTACRIWRLRSP